MSADRHIVFVGLMASGKTTAGRALASELGRPFLDCDEMLLAHTGRTASEIAAADGLEALHALEADVLLEALARDTPSVVTAAASTIDDAQCRAALADAYVVWMRAELATLVTRARGQSHRPLGDDVAAQLADQAQRRDPLFAAIADEVRDP